MTLRRPQVLPSEKETTHYLIDRFVHAFFGDGWDSNDAASWCGNWHARRQLGEVVQKVGFFVTPFGSDQSLSVYFGFAVPRVDDALAKFAPAEHSKRLKQQAAQGASYSNLTIPLEQLFEADEVLVLGIKGRNCALITVQCIDELERWSDVFIEWFRSRGSSTLDAVQDVAALSRLLDSESHRDVAQLRDRSCDDLLTFLLIAHMAGSRHMASWITYARRCAGSFGSAKPNAGDECWTELARVVDLLASNEGATVPR